RVNKNGFGETERRFRRWKAVICHAAGARIRTAAAGKKPSRRLNHRLLADKEGSDGVEDELGEQLYAAAEDLLDERNSGFLSQQSLQTDKNLFGRAVRRGSSRQRPARGTFGTRRRRECDALGGHQRRLHIRETDLPDASCKSHLFFDRVQ